MSFSSMDQSTADDWKAICSSVSQRQGRMPITITSMLLQLRGVFDGFAIDQLAHALQTATRATRDGATEEMVVAALCHDIGKAISVVSHAAIGAEILKPYVSPDTYQIVRTHQDFQGRHFNAFIGLDPGARARHHGEPWYELAERFADEWDQRSFDPDYDSLTLAHFAPMIERVFSKQVIDVRFEARSVEVAT